MVVHGLPKKSVCWPRGSHGQAWQRFTSFLAQPIAFDGHEIRGTTGALLLRACAFRMIANCSSCCARVCSAGALAASSVAMPQEEPSEARLSDKAAGAPPCRL